MKTAKRKCLQNTESTNKPEGRVREKFRIYWAKDATFEFSPKTCLEVDRKKFGQKDRDTGISVQGKSPCKSLNA